VGDRPSLVIVRSHIGYGSPNKQDTHEAHGSPLGEEEIRLTKQAYDWPSEEPFFVPDEALEHFREAGARVNLIRDGDVAPSIARLIGYENFEAPDGRALTTGLPAVGDPPRLVGRHHVAGAGSAWRADPRTDDRDSGKLSG
jgi:hypothetical protein